MRAKLLNTTSVRLAAMGVALASTSAVIVFVVIYIGALGAMRTTLDTELNNEIAEIMVRGPDTPPAVIDAGVRAAIAAPPTGTFFRLMNAQGQIVASNLALPPLAQGWHSLTAPKRTRFPDHIRALRVRVQRLATGGTLLVAANASMLDEMDALILRSFLIGFGITLAIGLAAGIGFGRRALGRIEAVSAAGEKIMAGDFTKRIPLSGSGDEFDHLGTVINAMLARIELLIGNIRAVGDEIAHDLRAPLTRLRQSLELMLRERAHPDLPSALADAIDQVDATLALSAGILRLAQIESGARRASFAKLDLSRLLDDIADTYATVAEDHGATLQAAIEPDLSLTGDAALLNQLFSNLIENALTHAGPAAAISLTARRSHTNITITLSDHGPGIPAGRHAEALRRFGRLDPSRSTEGHGLGLPIARAITALHDGTFTLSATNPARERPGLTIILALPA
jgi:signal transduction histidine kinase